MNLKSVLVCAIMLIASIAALPNARADGRAGLLTSYYNQKNGNAWLQLSTAIIQNGTSWETHTVATHCASKAFYAKALETENLAYARWQAETAAATKPSDYAPIGTTLLQSISMLQKAVGAQAAAAVYAPLPVGGNTCGACHGTGRCYVCDGSGRNLARTALENARAARTFTSGIYYGRRSLAEAAIPRSCPTCRGRGRCRHCNGTGVR